MLDESRSPEAVDELNVAVDVGNRTISVRVRDSDSVELTVLVNSTWLDDLLLEPALANFSYQTETYAGSSWYGIRVSGPSVSRTLVFERFKPSASHAVYSKGSYQSIRLERPMFVSLSEVPRVEVERVVRSNANGTWTEDIPRFVPRLGINFTDLDTTGQTVVLNKRWLGTLGLTNPVFRHADGTPISNSSDSSFFYLRPEHFSILYAFTTEEAFTKESDQAWSDVHWDSVNHDIYILSDRRDPEGTSEMLRSPVASPPVTYDQTTSFTVRATWQTSQQGNWQTAFPVFLTASGNVWVDSANSFYVLYESRDSNLRWQPIYHLHYRDGGGNLRVATPVMGHANLQHHFEISYNAYARSLRMAVYDAYGNALGSVQYSLTPGETFSVGKVGAASSSWPVDHTSEPLTIAKTDNIYLDASMARNGNFEVDGNGDNVPDYWEKWIWSKGNVYRSSDRAKFGTWSVKITDSSSTKDYGLQTNRMSASAGQSYTGSSWVYASSGTNWMCIEFWDAMSRGTRLSAGCKTTSTTGQWEYLDLTMTAPSGTLAVDLLVYSSASNVGTGYFDGAELRRSRAFWAIEVHGDHLPDEASWGRALGYITDLGINYIRIDFAWKDFEPQRDVTNWGLVSYWDKVVRMARERGLGIVAILGYVPGWATILRDCGLPCGYGNGDLEAFFQEWRAFVRDIAARWGQDIQYYQLLNEENHPAHDEFPNGRQDGEVRAFYEAFQGLLEGTGLTAAEHKSRFKTIVNLWADYLPFGNDWDRYFREILGDARGKESIDIIALDHYPGTWCCGSNYRDWAVLGDSAGTNGLLKIARDFNKERAIMETGFSTYSDTWGHGRDDQEFFVDLAIDEVLAKKNSQNANYPQNALLLISWYEFLDKDSTGGGFPEYHFGILAYDGGTGAWGVKEAYDNLRYQVSRWS